ncbi:adhesion G-protein coupled receptor G5 [Ornithorhynchus anatinus]|uniref:adhesion G-protein coupled receptor G5 n=1 Tax=Ornithorhynchus anatinus TaxID=9258 RepID=UPI0019D49B13|nr:adhesion G-protein coupled receptor G5 [Ornithorhynchus anatinus]
MKSILLACFCCFFIILCRGEQTVSNDTESNVKNKLKLLEKLALNGTTEKQRSPSQLRCFEDWFLNLSFHDSNLSVRSDYIHSLAFKLNCNFSGLRLHSDRDKDKVGHEMQFPAELVKRPCVETSRKIKLICIYFTITGLFKDAKNSILLNNNILGARLDNYSISGLKDMVNISFRHSPDLEKTDMTCVFWKEGEGKQSSGSWESDGCQTIREKTWVRCRCNHLTYFAVLMKISSAAIDEKLLAPLTYISIVGCSISVVASLFTILLLLRSRKEDNCLWQIHINLPGSVLLLNGTFLLAVALASEGPGCVALASFLHFSLLSCLTWMAIEGFHLYRLLVRVYNIYIRHYLLKLCAFGWGFPSLVVLCLLLIDRTTYGYHEIKFSTRNPNATISNSSALCWINSQMVQNVFVLGYGGVTILFNLVILILVARVIWGLRAKNCQQRTQGPMVFRDMLIILGLTVLLGTTWILAFFYFKVVQEFLFSIINSLYGLFLFLWFFTRKSHPDPESKSTSSSSR